MTDDIETTTSTEPEPAAEQTSEPRRKKNRPPKDDPAYRQIIDRFQACGRCSYFLGDCEVRFGHDTILEAIGEDGDWISLVWSESLRRMLRQAYAVGDDVVYASLEGICPECMRPFAFDSEGDGDQQPYFRIRR